MIVDAFEAYRREGETEVARLTRERDAALAALKALMALDRACVCEICSTANAIGLTVAFAGIEQARATIHAIETGAIHDQ